MKSGNKQTVTRHVDNLKYSHVYPKVNDELAEWCEETYGSDNLGDVKFVRGKIHYYLGMIMDFTQEGALKINMKHYIEGMLEESPHKIKGAKKTPWTEKLLKIQEDAKKLDEERRGIFHTYVMKAMFFLKIARPDIDQEISFLSSIVKEANKVYWKKLLRVMSLLNVTINDVLTLEVNDTNILTWYIGVALAVHSDMKSRTGAIFTMGKGEIISSSAKKKVNPLSCIES